MFPAPPSSVKENLAPFSHYRRFPISHPPCTSSTQCLDSTQKSNQPAPDNQHPQFNRLDKNTIPRTKKLQSTKTNKSMETPAPIVHLQSPISISKYSNLQSSQSQTSRPPHQKSQKHTKNSRLDEQEKTCMGQKILP